MLQFPQFTTTEANVFRVTNVNHDDYQVIDSAGQLYSAKIAGHFYRQNTRPVIGDYVMGKLSHDLLIIDTILPRQTVLKRQHADQVQVFGVNIDYVFITMALNSDFNLNRLQRYLTLAYDSGATPVVLLTKADLAPRKVAKQIIDVEAVTFGAVDVVVVAKDKPANSQQALMKLLQPGKTGIFVGSSGVGKSTLLNLLIDSDVATRKTRADGRGRHTTTTRQLHYLANGAALIDSPGVREVGISSNSDFAVEQVFKQIKDLSQFCRFADCQHAGEPDCAVKQALVDGELDSKVWENYQKMMIESEYAGLSSRQIETKKLRRMMGGKQVHKQIWKRP